MVKRMLSADGITPQHITYESYERTVAEERNDTMETFSVVITVHHSFYYMLISGAINPGPDKSLQ